MNELIEKLAVESLIERSGELIFSKEKFTELVVEQCCQVLHKESIIHAGYGYNQYGLYQKLREHFGIQE